MAEQHHRVWFERAVADELRPLVPTSVVEFAPMSADDPYDGIEQAQGVMASSLAYDGAVMDRAPDLRVVCRTGIGYDKVDLAAATERGIACANTPDGPTVSTAEHAVMLMLMAAKRTTVSMERLRAGESDLYARNRAIELNGKTLGLVGFGRIARRVATAAVGVGMDVVAFDPFLPAEAFTVARAQSLERLLSEADVVSVHIPLTDGSRRMFDAKALGRMRRGAIFVNAARGGIVDHDALLAALESGHLFAAGLDVTDPEPLPPDHPLLTHPGVVVTPHVASATGASRRRIFGMAIEQVVQVLEGVRPPHLLNEEVWQGVRHE